MLNSQRPKIRVGSIYSSNNGGDGIRSRGVDLEVGTVISTNNHGKGINIIDDNQTMQSQHNNHKEIKFNWHERPIGLIMLTISCGLVVAFLSYYFGWTK